MTNYEKIKNMSVEEIENADREKMHFLWCAVISKPAEVIKNMTIIEMAEQFEYEDICPVGTVRICDETEEYECVKCWTNWLEREADDE